MLITLIVVGFIIIEAAGQGWKLYMYDPGLAEYIVSLAFLAPVVLWVVWLFRRF